jgi:FKBP-type peptidyl-prolyl cis-trans isomerase FkpA
MRTTLIGLVAAVALAACAEKGKPEAASGGTTASASTPAAAPGPAPAPAAPAAPLVVKKIPTGTPEVDITYEELRAGDGESPTAQSKVKVHYRGTLADGTEFDSSYKRGEPIEFPLFAVVKCWTLGVQQMKVGAKARLTCPPSVAYGDRGTPGGPIPPNATLTFEIELLDFRR